MRRNWQGELELEQMISDPEKDLVLALTYFLRVRKPEDHKLIFRGAHSIKLFMQNCIGMSDYCYLSYPDICICGKEFGDRGRVLRLHCEFCQGQAHTYELWFDCSMIRIKFDISISWMEYALAHAIKLHKGSTSCQMKLIS